MEELTIDLTYGTALFEAARETGKTDLINEEAGQLRELFGQEPDLHKFVNTPGISAEEKKNVLENVFRGRICDELLNFLFILVDKGRMMHFEKMIKTYRKLLDKQEGVSYGTVFSAAPLNDEHIRELEEDASKLFRVNVKLVNEIDPKLIGGVKLLVEGKLIDASVRKRFDDLSSQIRMS